MRTNNYTIVKCIPKHEDQNLRLWVSCGILMLARGHDAQVPVCFLKKMGYKEIIVKFG